MEIITRHEHEQRDEVRKPLWPTYAECNGNCRQSRACDCVPNFDAPPDDEAWAAEGRRAAAWFWCGSIAGCTVLAVLVALVAGWRP